jgi:hypothetical protein
MKKQLLPLALTLSIASAEDLSGQIEARWQVNKRWQSKDPVQEWVAAQDWQSELAVDIRTQQNGLGFALAILPTNAQLRELFVDFSGQQAEWTVGQKPQEWAYAFGSDALNWLDDTPMILREQYLPWSTLQTYCASDFTDRDGHCGVRLSGWGTIEWQVMARHQNYTSMGGGFQTVLNDQWLVFSEALYHHKKTGESLLSISTDTFVVQSQKENGWETNLGVQVSTTAGTAVQYEWHYDEHRLNAQQWNQIQLQLESDSALLIANALQSPRGEHQHLLRFAQDWQSLNAEGVMIYWPDTENSLLFQASLTQELSQQLSVSLEWQQPSKPSLLAQIGQGGSVKIGLVYSEGF